MTSSGMKIPRGDIFGKIDGARERDERERWCYIWG